MNKTWIIAKREYITAVKTKAFLIGLIIAPLLFSGGGIAIALLKDTRDVKDKTIAVVDHSGVAGEALESIVDARNETDIYDEESGKQVKPAYHLEFVEPEEEMDELRLMLSDRVRDDELHAFLEIGSEVVSLSGEQEDRIINYHAKSAAMDEFRTWVVYPLNAYLRSLRMQEVGVPKEKASTVLTWIDVTPMGLVEKDRSGEVKEARKSSEIEGFLLPFGLGMMLYMMIITGAMPQLSSVIEEKSQRIAEVMLGSVKPFSFMMGKIIGGVGVTLTGSAIYLIMGVFVAKVTNVNIDIPYHIIPWFIVYLMLAVFFYGAIYSALGATCNDPKDAQNITLPALIPLVFPIFLLVPVIQEPTAAFSMWTSLIPFFAPILMIVRVATPIGVPLWQPVVGAIVLFVFTIAAVWMGGRVFRVAILIQGMPPKFSNLIKWALKG